tara:strand:- start:161 stop:565 length:405 start_codon:yes stop_codon:yes gene_type:complete
LDARNRHNICQFFRLCLAHYLGNQTKQVLSAARAPEGRFHRSGQKALYVSLTAHGAGVALGYYLRVVAPRTMVTMQLRSKRIVDATDPQIASQLGFDIADTAWPWQDDRRENICPRTWTVIDRAREIGADVMNF